MPELSTPPRRSSTRAHTPSMSSASNGSSVRVTRTPPRVTDSVPPPAWCLSYRVHVCSPVAVTSIWGPVPGREKRPPLPGDRFWSLRARTSHRLRGGATTGSWCCAPWEPIGRPVPAPPLRAHRHRSPVDRGPWRMLGGRRRPWASFYLCIAAVCPARRAARGHDRPDARPAPRAGRAPVRIAARPPEGKAHDRSSAPPGRQARRRARRGGTAPPRRRRLGGRGEGPPDLDGGHRHQQPPGQRQPRQPRPGRQPHLGRTTRSPGPPR